MELLKQTGKSILQTKVLTNFYPQGSYMLLLSYWTKQITEN